MSEHATAMVCAGCGHRAAPEDPSPFRCPRASSGDDVDHVMARVLDPEQITFPDGSEPNPFVRYRTLFHGYHVARRQGMSDRGYIALVEELDRAVASIVGHGFEVTPYVHDRELSRKLGFEEPGGVWVKDETGNVAGSHKARHLMGVMLFLRVVDGAADAGTLAIASCGNAAVAAAVVAQAAGRDLSVFVPTWADPAVLEELRRSGATLVTCPREAGAIGDPTYARLQRAIRDGAVPFTCQGPDNGLAIEGGATLGYEMVSSIRGADAPSPDRVVVQVGGGALASSVIQALEDAIRLGVAIPLPRIDTVQTVGGHPLERAWRLLMDRASDDPGRDDVQTMARARSHRSELMWPWEPEPRSVATGILDDETYDWAAAIHGMLRSGGQPVVVTEEDLIEANALAVETTGIPVDETGSAGLAGLLRLRRDGIASPGERVAVLFTGRRRTRPTR